MRTSTLTISLALSFGAAVVGQAAVTGQWDFNSADLSATVGNPLGYRGDTAALTMFTTATINGETAHVMRFPEANRSQGYIMTHGIAPNGGGGGIFVNQYTLILDVMYPQTSTERWRPFLQTDPANSNDGELFVNPANGIGISSVYQGTVLPDTWHRIAFVVDLTLQTDRLRKFIDGTLVGTQNLASGINGRWALGPTALLFADEDGETAVGYVNSVQIHDLALSDGYINLLGGATAAGIPVPEQTVGLLLLLALALVYTWRRTCRKRLESRYAR